MPFRRLLLIAALVLVSAAPAAAAGRPPDGLWAGHTIKGQSFFFFVTEDGTRAGGFVLSDGGCAGGSSAGLSKIDSRGHVRVSDIGDEGSGTLALTGRLTPAGTARGEWGSGNRVDQCAVGNALWTAALVKTTLVRGPLVAGPALAGPTAAWVEASAPGTWRVRRGRAGAATTTATIRHTGPQSRVFGLDASSQAIAVSFDPNGAPVGRVIAGAVQGPLRRMAGAVHESVARVDGRLVVDEPRDFAGRIVVADALTGRYARPTGPIPPDAAGRARIAGSYVAYRHADAIEVARLTTRDVNAAPALSPVYAVDATGVVSFSVGADGDLLVARPAADFEFDGHAYDLYGYRRADPTPVRVSLDGFVADGMARLPAVLLDGGRTTLLARVPLLPPMAIVTAPLVGDSQLHGALAFPDTGVQRVGAVVGRGDRVAFAFRLAHRHGQRLSYGPVHVAVVPRR